MPGKRVARPPQKQGRKRRAAAVGVAALLVLGVAWAAFALLSGGSDKFSASGNTRAQGASTGTATASQKPSPTPSQKPSPTPSRTPSPTPSGSSATGDPQLRSCASEVSKAETVVSAATKGVDDWNTHVQARTDMFDGRISVETMDALWKRTRLAGPADLQRFHSAEQGYDATSHCTDLRGSGGEEAAAGCEARAGAATRAVAAARAAMGDWESHLGNMASYAHGDMTRDHAQTMWVAAWKDAPTNISAYRNARAALERAPSCAASQD